MPKTPDCDHCQFYAHDPHLVCAVHPVGVVTELGRSVEGKCLDFRKEPNSLADKDEQWSPEGYFWYARELLSIRCQRHASRTPTLTTEEQLAILDSHPIFTGVCPKCGREFDRNDLPVIHWEGYRA